MLVPAMQSTGTRISSSTLSTPMCAAPRAPPPESTRQIRGRGDASPGGEAVPAGSADAAAARRRTASGPRARLTGPSSRSEPRLDVGEVAVHPPREVAVEVALRHVDLDVGQL